MSKPGRVTILGAGRMGADMALAFAGAGWRCGVHEVSAKRRKEVQKYWKAECKRRRIPASRLALVDSLDQVDWKAQDLLIEAVTEDLALKHRLLRQIEPRMRRDACIATNTSGLRIGDVTRVLKYPARSGGMHFMVPAHVMPAVEITRGPKTSPATLKRFIGWVEAMGKAPVVLQRDVPGQLINRIQHAMYREIYHLIDEGVVTPVDVDRAVRFGFGFRYQIIGPVASRDIHGLPVHLATAKNIYPTLHNGRAAPRVLERLVKAGHHGVRTGRGFYKWDRRTVDRRLRRFTELLENGFKRVKRASQPLEF